MRLSIHMCGIMGTAARIDGYKKTLYGFNPLPTLLRYTSIGSAELHRSPLGVPGTGLRVWDDWYGHKEDICGRSFNELNVIHTR